MVPSWTGPPWTSGSPPCSTTAPRPATARSRQLAVRRFSAWLAAEGEIPADELARMSPPKLYAKAVDPLSDEQLVSMLAACKGPELRDKRDEAIIRLMTETGARAGEILALQMADVDLTAGMAVIHRGKGGKGRRVPFGPRTGAAIDRYIRARRRHRLAATPALWLGRRAADSPTTGCGTPSPTAPSAPGSAGSTSTGCGTPPRTAGSPQEAPRAA